MAITREQLIANDTLLRYWVSYECVEDRFNMRIGDTFRASFEIYDVERFQSHAPEGWEIRTIEQYEVPDR